MLYPILCARTRSPYLFVFLLCLLSFGSAWAVPSRLNFDVHTITLKNCILPTDSKAYVFNGAQLHDKSGVYEISAFRDIGNSLKVRFRVDPESQWQLIYNIKNISCHGEISSGNSVDNVVNVKSLSSPRINRKNGFLEFDDGRRFLMLAESLWFCPSNRCPISGVGQPNRDFFNKLVIDRKEKKFNTLLLAFMGNEDDFYRPSKWGAGEYSRWSSYDEYFDLMSLNSFYIGVGFGFHNILKKVPMQELKDVWTYLVARYAAYPVFWFVAGEYSFKHDPVIQSNAIELLGMVEKMDPYHSILTLHPWIYSGDDGLAISRDILDINLIQGGHGKPPPPSVYGTRLRRSGGKLRSIQIECAFEGVLNNTSTNLRDCAYMAMQSGSIGFGYGANGVWYPYIPYGNNEYKDWGDSIEWGDALNQPGSSQMSYLFQIYSRLDISRLEPVLEKFDCGQNSPLVSRFGSDLAIYYRFGGYSGNCSFESKNLRKFSGGDGFLINPRTGKFIRENFPTTDGEIPIPPDDKDWIYLTGPRAREISRALVRH